MSLEHCGSIVTRKNRTREQENTELREMNIKQLELAGLDLLQAREDKSPQGKGVHMYFLATVTGHVLTHRYPSFKTHCPYSPPGSCLILDPSFIRDSWLPMPGLGSLSQSPALSASS
jgi:hypothetical protein